ncbi:MAG TPA: DUF3291 domain-containing protein [Candidatus Sulfotelmatobacter sp.]
MANYHIAQVNIGRVRAPVNALADRSPGFVWRLQTSVGNATYFRPYSEDDRILINMSVWENIAALRHYVYRTAQAELLRQRESWFEKFSGTYLALWWVPAGHRPGMDEATKRLAHLEKHGPTQFSFTFIIIFEPGEQFQRAIDWSSFVPCPAA